MCAGGKLSFQNMIIFSKNCQVILNYVNLITFTVINNHINSPSFCSKIDDFSTGMAFMEKQ